jgi:hypothetical protein
MIDALRPGGWLGVEDFDPALVLWKSIEVARRDGSPEV